MPITSFTDGSCRRCNRPTVLYTLSRCLAVVLQSIGDLNKIESRRQIIDEHQKCTSCVHTTRGCLLRCMAMDRTYQRVDSTNKLNMHYQNLVINVSYDDVTA